MQKVQEVPLVGLMSIGERGFVFEDRSPCRCTSPNRPRHTVYSAREEETETSRLLSFLDIPIQSAKIGNADESKAPLRVERKATGFGMLSVVSEHGFCPSGSIIWGDRWQNALSR